MAFTFSGNATQPNTIGAKVGGFNPCAGDPFLRIR